MVKVLAQDDASAGGEGSERSPRALLHQEKRRLGGAVCTSAETGTGDTHRTRQGNAQHSDHGAVAGSKGSVHIHVHMRTYTTAIFAFGVGFSRGTPT